MGFAWILYRWKINVKRLPSLGEKLTVRTWSSGMERIYAYRSFRIFDEQDNIICEALSTWLVINIEKRSVCSVPPDIFDKYVNLDECIFKNVYTANPLSLAKDELLTVPYTVRKHHLDYNLHMNNAKYVELFLDSVNLEIEKSFDLEVTYKKECLLGNEISCTYFNTDNTNTVVAVIKLSDADNNRNANTLFKLEV